MASNLRLKVALRTDHRVKLMNEIISGIQVIKMYAWEKPFEQIIKLARKKEIAAVTTASYLRGFFLSSRVFIERTTLFLTVVCYALLGNVITADKVFSLAQFYNVLQEVMAIRYPLAVTFTAEAVVSVRRIQKFLCLEEKPQSTIKRTDDHEIVLENVAASWSNLRLTISNFDLIVPKGGLCAIVGPVGAGKSSILQLLLGELPLINGSVSVGGSISYASQKPWLFASTVKNNILFGRDYDKQLYKKVVKACALEKDFSQFPQGDGTIVGERGVSLSGGQRARINLARAVYRDAEIYLLDDPLSAVDPHVSKHLFEECIITYLQGKTRVLVTHQLQYLKKADLVVVINEGVIEAKGTFQELQNRSDLDFTKLLVDANGPSEKTEEKTKLDIRKVSIVSSKSIATESEGTIDKAVENDEELGNAKSTPFKDYVRSSGSCCSILSLITVLILSQAACSGADYWVTFWTQEEAIRTANKTLISSSLKSNWLDALTEEVIVDNSTNYLVKREISIYIYSVLIIAVICLTVLRSIGFFKMAMNASRHLHNQMFHALLQAPMRFFDTNPSGRVLNRFSKDMGAIDEMLPGVMADAVQILLVMSGILIMITVANYYMVVAMVVVGAFFLKVRSWYVDTAKDVKHLEGITKSPVFSHLNSSLNGIITIRASEAEKILCKQFDTHQDNHTAAWFLTIATRVCFGLWLDLISVCFVAILIFSFILLNQYGQVSGSLVGLAISQGLILTGMLQHGMRQTAEVINQMTSVERIMQYTKLESENKAIAKEAETNNWPNKGLIEFRDLSLQYSEFDPPVLRHLNFFIVPGSKTGIVGRTGAGKSSLISALFRLAPLEGDIVIDGINTKNVQLNELRKRISIIPQEPILFSASIRYNLDPFEQFEDEKLWEVLEEVELKENIPSLSYKVTEGGNNFSLGQRQLICLARAILRDNKILVLDEATANVDPRTDALIQETIRRKFKNCTVLTIAHRLNTIMDADKILVMDAGRLVEFDHPHILLQDKDSTFSKMVAETGAAMTEQLKQTAEDFYLNVR